MCVSTHTHHTCMHHTYRGTHTYILHTPHWVSSQSPKNWAVQGAPHPPSNSVVCIPDSLRLGYFMRSLKRINRDPLMHVKLITPGMTPPHNGVADTSNRCPPAPPCWMEEMELMPKRGGGWSQRYRANIPRGSPGSRCTWVHFVHFKATAFNKTNLFWSVPALHVERRLREFALSLLNNYYTK